LLKLATFNINNINKRLDNLSLGERKLNLTWWVSKSSRQSRTPFPWTLFGLSGTKRSGKANVPGTA